MKRLFPEPFLQERTRQGHAHLWISFDHRRRGSADLGRESLVYPPPPVRRVARLCRYHLCQLPNPGDRGGVPHRHRHLFFWKKLLWVRSSGLGSMMEKLVVEWGPICRSSSPLLLSRRLSGPPLERSWGSLCRGLLRNGLRNLDVLICIDYHPPTWKPSPTSYV